MEKIFLVTKKENLIFDIIKTFKKNKTIFYIDKETIQNFSNSIGIEEYIFICDLRNSNAPTTEDLEKILNLDDEKNLILVLDTKKPSSKIKNLVMLLEIKNYNAETLEFLGSRCPKSLANRVCRVLNNSNQSLLILEPIMNHIGWEKIPMYIKPISNTFISQTRSSFFWKKNFLSDPINGMDSVFFLENIFFRVGEVEFFFEYLQIKNKNSMRESY